MNIEGIKGNTPVFPKLENQHQLLNGEHTNKFHKMLNKEQTEEIGSTTKKELEDMLASLNELKGQLDKDLTIDNLENYRKEMKKFLEYCTEHEMVRQDNVYRDRRGIEKKVTVIKMANQEMEKMTKQLLKNNYDHLSVLEQIGRIHGMVINLLA